MSKILIFATITITLALIFYTTGVWSEHKAKVLKKWHVFIFWIGLAFDTLGTSAMTQISKKDVNSIPTHSLNIHAITGALAILLMFIHAVWASWVLYKNDERTKQVFHKFSIIVWFIWLVPYVVGMFMGMK